MLGIDIEIDKGMGMRGRGVVLGAGMERKGMMMMPLARLIRVEVHRRRVRRRGERERVDRGKRGKKTERRRMRMREVKEGNEKGKEWTFLD
jgi:hypothetical protein